MIAAAVVVDKFVTSALANLRRCLDVGRPKRVSIIDKLNYPFSEAAFNCYFGRDLLSL